MRPTYLGLNIARNALLAHQQTLDTIGHNISNASVEGYSRQRLHLSAAPDLPGLGSGYPGSVGQGVQADQLQRLRDMFLDREYRGQQQQQSRYATQASYTQRMETYLGELDKSGLGVVLDNFFNAWQQLSLRPDDLAVRRTVVAAGESLAQSIRELHVNVTQVQQDSEEELRLNVDEVNRLTRNIATLNDQIRQRVNLGDTPADLMDERDRHLDALSKLVAIQVNDNADGSVNVLIDNQSVVFADGANPIRLNKTEGMLRGSLPVGFPVTLNQGDLVINGVDIIGSDPALTLSSANDAGFLLQRINAKSAQTGITASLDPSGRLLLAGSSEGSDYIDITTTGNGLTATGIANGNYTVTDTIQMEIKQGLYIHQPGGKLQGLLDVKRELIPATMDKIHQLTSTLIQQVNDVHQHAYDLNGQTGRPFFTGTNPATMQVGATLLADPSRLAIAGSAAFPPGDNSQALAIANLRQNAMLNGQTLDSYYRSLVTDMGQRIADAQNKSEQLALTLHQVDNQRQSVAGVNLDEELTYMLQAQRAFGAAARFITTMDEMLAQVVNGLGLVGR